VNAYTFENGVTRPVAVRTKADLENVQREGGRCWTFPLPKVFGWTKAMAACARRDAPSRRLDGRLGSGGTRRNRICRRTISLQGIPKIPLRTERKGSGDNSVVRCEIARLCVNEPPQSASRRGQFPAAASTFELCGKPTVLDKKCRPSRSFPGEFLSSEATGSALDVFLAESTEAPRAQRGERSSLARAGHGLGACTADDLNPGFPNSAVYFIGYAGTATPARTGDL
jgi:hypothetical protein